MMPADKEQNSTRDRVPAGPAGFKHNLERLGPIFMRLGQFLALRSDVIPPEYCDELLGLYDRVPPFSSEEAIAILREDLGRNPKEVFAYLNPRPIATGVVAQTHLARTTAGALVSVKILRPDIRSLVLRDLGRAKLLARLLKLSGASLLVSPNELVTELTDWMMQEIDFDRELNNLTRLYNLSLSNSFAIIPKPFPELSSGRVITSEYLKGIPLIELLESGNLKDPLKGERTDRYAEINRDRLAENLITALLNQIFRDQFFNANLHPQNLQALPGDRIGFVDFGLCWELAETVMRSQSRYVAAVFSGDLNKMFGSMNEVLIPTEKTEVDAFRSEFVTEITAALSKTKLAEQSSISKRSVVARTLGVATQAARRNYLRIPANVLAMHGALVTADTVAAQLSGSTDLRKVGSRFISALRVEESLRALEPDSRETNLHSFLSLLRDSPAQVHQVLSQLSEGRLELKVNVSESTKARRNRDRRARLLVASVLTVGISLLLSLAHLPRALGVSLAWPLSVVLAALYGWILFQWRRLR